MSEQVRGGRLVAGATDVVDLGGGDFAEIRRRMNYAITRQLASRFTGPTPMSDYLAAVLELNVTALRGSGYGCTLEHDHGDPASHCDTPAVTRAVLDDLDPDDADAIIEAVAARNLSLRRRVQPADDSFPPSATSFSPAPSATAEPSPDDSQSSSSVNDSAGPGTS